MRALALAAALLALAACGKSPCEELGSRVCSCQATSASAAAYASLYGSTTGNLDACTSAIQAQLNTSSPTSADEQRCQGFLNTCPGSSDPNFCARILTPQGKVECGMAYSPAP